MANDKSDSTNEKDNTSLLERLRRPAIWLVVVVLASTLILTILDFSASSDPPYLILSLNMLLVGIPCLFLAAIAAISFLRTGIWPAICLGGGSLAFGLAVFLSGPLQTFTTINSTITAHNISTLLAGILFLIGSLFVVNRVTAREDKTRRRSTMLQIYISILVFVAVITILSLRGLLPPFFIQGTGGTPIRQIVLVADVILFLLSSLIIFSEYLRSRSSLLFWYSLALLLTVFGLIGFLIQTKTGTPLNWMGRSAELLGGVYFLMTALVTLKEARFKQVSMGEAMADLFTQMEIRLKESEEKYRSIVETASEGIWICDRNARTTFVNGKMSELLGYSEEEMMGKTGYEFMDQEAKDLAKSNFERRLKGQKDRYEQKYVRKDGSTLWAIASASPMLDKNGEVVASLSMITDITERKKAELTLKETSDYLNNLLNYANAPIIVWDPSFHVTRFNHAFERLVGRTAEEVIGNHLEMLFPDDSRDHAMEYVRRAVGGEHMEVAEIPIKHKNGSIRIVLWNSATLYDTDNKTPTATIAQGQDITERKKAEERLGRSNEKINEILSSIKDDFYVLDRDWNFVYANQIFTSRIGKEPKDFVGNNIWKMFPKHIGTIYEENLRSAMDKREIRRFEISGKYTDAWYQMAVFPSQEGVTVLGTDITEQKKAEQALRRQQAEIQTLFENIPAGLVLFEAARPYKVLVHNRYYQELFAEPFRSSGMAGLNVYQYAPEVEASGVVTVFDEVVQTKQPKSFLDFPYNANPSKESWFNWYVAPIIIDERVVALVSMSLEVTERHIAEQALKESEERFRAIADNTPDHILVQDANLRYTFVVNPQVGLTEKDMLGKTDYDILAKLDAEKLTRIKKQVIATGKRFHLETSLVNKEGKLEYFSGAYVPKFNREGHADGLIGYFRDITERKEIEESLRRSEERWNAAIENFTEGAIIATEDEQIIYWNPAARQMHGFKTSEEGIGPLKETLNTFELWTLDGNHLLELEERPMKRIKRGETVRNLELRLRRPDQSWEKIVSYSGTLVGTPGGERLIFLSVFDLTEQRKAEEALQRYTKELEAVNKELEAFSYSVSHDLRTPLRTLDGFSEMVLTDYGDRLDEAGKDYLNRIRNASHDMSELIDAILKLTRISRAEMYWDEVDLSDLAKSITEGLKQRQLERQADFMIEPGMVVKGDMALLRIALNNLLENAWKYTSKCPVTRIEIGSLFQNGKKVFFIKDNGVGFDMRYKNKLFQPFQRLHTDNEYQGTGIGLATVQRVIRRHNGHVWAESEIGKGTTFYFTLE
jgi:PAS domain S-box-containing protein